MATMTALQTVTVGSGGVSSITFSSIPQTYTDLIIKTSARGANTQGGGGYFYFIYPNGQSTNILGKWLVGNGVSASSSNGSIAYDFMDASDYTSNTFSNNEMYFPNYTGSTYKSFSSDSVNENNATGAFAQLEAGLWSQTDAITSLTLTPAGGNFAQYSTFTLYGVYRGAETQVQAPTIGTATPASAGANVAFTPSATGAPASSYIATSSPDGITATGYSSPILVTGLTIGTPYTFTVKGQNPGGVGLSSAASNSVTPYDGYESIATVYATGSSSVINFTSVPSGYKHLQIRSIQQDVVSAAAGTEVGFMQFNNDTGTNYSTHRVQGDGSTASASGAANTSSIYVMIMNHSYNSAATYGVGIVDILDYADTSKYKTVRDLSGVDTNSSNGVIALRSGNWRSTSAITSIKVTTSSGNNWGANSVFELYGIR